MRLDNGHNLLDTNMLTRRDFLKQTAMTAGVASAPGRAIAQALANAQPNADEHRSSVVQVRSERLLTSRGVHEDLLFDLIEILLCRLGGNEDAASVWKSLLKPDDIIALKFNRNGAQTIGTNDAMLRALVRSLGNAGFDPKQLVAIEVPQGVREETACAAPVSGWSDKEYDFGSGKDRLASWLNQVTAIINVPFLKNHNISAMTCCLKNLSHALVKHPAQFHKNGCSPYIGDIVALPEVRDKLRIHIANGIRVVFEGGPEAKEEYLWDARLLLGGFDPVAVDTVGVQILNRVRYKLELGTILPNAEVPDYLKAADSAGLGTCELHRIDVEKAKL